MHVPLKQNPIQCLNSFQSIPIWQQTTIKVVVMLLIVFSFFVIMRSVLRKKKLCKYFGLTDLSAFRIYVQKKKTTDMKYTSLTENNSYQLQLPHYRLENEDGSPKKRFFNKIIWEDSILWLHLKSRTYILKTNDPWAMLFLIHTLRMNGHDIEPCELELEKQQSVTMRWLDTNTYFETLTERIETPEAFAELCRQHLQNRGYLVQNASGDTSQTILFTQKEGKPQIVKCLLASRTHLIGLEDMTAIKEEFDMSLAENCTLITTGELTVHAARYAMDNYITLITGARLISLLEDETDVQPGKEFLRWELTGKDLTRLIPTEILSGKKLKI